MILDNHSENKQLLDDARESIHKMKAQIDDGRPCFFHGVHLSEYSRNELEDIIYIMTVHTEMYVDAKSLLSHVADIARSADTRRIQPSSIQPSEN